MSKLTKEEFQAYLKQIRELAEGPLEEIQKEVEVTNKFPQEFYDLAIKNDLYRFALPSQYGGWDLSELDILRVQDLTGTGRVLQRPGRNENASSLCNGFKLENPG
mgnify:CR=1 FL=1